MAVGAEKSIRVLTIFEFESSLQRMGCVCVDDCNNYSYFTKGSWEVISQLCKLESASLREFVDIMSLKGFRIIALGRRKIERLEISKS